MARRDGVFKSGNVRKFQGSDGQTGVLVAAQEPMRERVVRSLTAAGATCVDQPGPDVALGIVEHGLKSAPDGPALVREWLARGVRVAVGILSGNRRIVRREFFDAGAVDVLSPALPDPEWTRRLLTCLRHGQLEIRVRRQDRELMLVSVLAKRMVQAKDLRSRFLDGLATIGRALSLESLELRVLPPEMDSARLAAALLWPQQGGEAEPQNLDQSDILALRQRKVTPMEEKGGGGFVFPLSSAGRALASLRVQPPAVSDNEDFDPALVTEAGWILAAALEGHAAELIEGLSASPEAMVHDPVRETFDSQPLFQAVVDALPVSLHVIDRAFRIVVWNQAREVGPLGRPRGEVLGRNLFAAIGPDEDLKREYEEVFFHGRPQVSEVTSRGEGSLRIFRVEKVPMRLGRGMDVTHAITFAREITEQRAFERSMAQTEKLAAVGRLAAGIAHEINNPLATIAGCAESLQSRLSEPLTESDQEEARADAGVIEDEAYRCKDILGGLLDFSRQAPDQRGKADPAEIARRVLRLLRNNRRIAGVRIEWEAEADLPEIYVNEDQIVQALLALVINAADAAAPAGRVVVRAWKRGAEELAISVEDDGPGIPPELKERVFEPFFTTKPPGQGTGLGLSVAYGLIQAHGGRIELMSHPGIGTRFDVVLPIPVAALEPTAPGTGVL